LTVEPARPGDFARIAQLTVDVYVGGGLATPAYAPELADVAGRAERAELLVVRDTAGQVVGSVALVLTGAFGNVITSDEEAAFRMLVVDPAAQGRGIGELLVTTCLDRARAAGKRRMVISTDPLMTTAHRLYERLGFSRLPERDWRPEPGVDLLVYSRACD
jgi:ribosomal protein S18 acetylase RimI-like enzyme